MEIENMSDKQILELAEEMGFSAAFVATADVVQEPSFRSVTAISVAKPLAASSMALSTISQTR